MFFWEKTKKYIPRESINYSPSSKRIIKIVDITIDLSVRLLDNKKISPKYKSIINQSELIIYVRYAYYKVSNMVFWFRHTLTFQISEYFGDT